MIFLLWLIFIIIGVFVFLWLCEGLGVIIGIIWLWFENRKYRRKR